MHYEEQVYGKTYKPLTEISKFENRSLENDWSYEVVSLQEINVTTNFDISITDFDSINSIGPNTSRIESAESQEDKAIEQSEQFHPAHPLDQRAIVVESAEDLDNAVEDPDFETEDVQTEEAEDLDDSMSDPDYEPDDVEIEENENSQNGEAKNNDEPNERNKKIRVALAKSGRSTIRAPSPDRRGRHVPSNKLPENAIMAMNNHIDSFPGVPSHWCRRDTSKEYLEANLNKEIKYKLYLEYCQETQNKPVSKTIYKQAIIKKNIGFYHPRKDQCWCYNFNKDDTDEGNVTGRIKEEYDLHVKRKNAADEHRKADKTAAQEDKSIVCANFDLEAVLNCPIFFWKPVFYKRKLAVFNLTVYEVAPKQGHAFLWDETNGQRGSNEIATCVSIHFPKKPNIYDCILTHAPAKIKMQ
ncbi:unnamed protein product [Ceutorhynchus assimilis]|uniref:Uncharacterized protein n=1 Tax=Ceutorhynchus assimilis TaxID=467358 RepID=A0A9N9QMW3_9CUCU|nr:unnamed protein product [Ceutorhynchus assimilis]